MTIEEAIEEAAKVINPLAFKQKQEMYEFCISKGDSEEDARKYSSMYDADIRRAFGIARAAAPAIIRACADACWSIEDKDHLRALADQIEGK